MALTKVVNGETIACTPEEEAAIRAEWAAAARAPLPPLRDLYAEIDALKAQVAELIKEKKK